MDFLIAFGRTGKPSHAQPPAWFIFAGIAASILYLDIPANPDFDVAQARET
jgi:hypothetical protein